MLQNPVLGVSRPNEGANEGKTPAAAPKQALALLEAPDRSTLQGLRDRAMLSVLLYHGLRREELVRLRVCDAEEREGVMHFVVHGKGAKIRYVPIAPDTLEDLAAYLEEAGHGNAREHALFQPTRLGRGADPGKGLHPDGVRRLVKRYARLAGIRADRFSTHSLRSTSATAALDGGADIEEVARWLGHANPATTKLYDKRDHKAQSSPTFKIDYRSR